MTDKERFLKILGNNVKYYRELNHMSQEELAKKCGYDTDNARSAISKLEKGQRDPSASRLGNIASALGVSPIDLIKDYSENDTLFDFMNKYLSLSPENRKVIDLTMDSMLKVEGEK